MCPSLVVSSRDWRDESRDEGILEKEMLAPCQLFPYNVVTACRRQETWKCKAGSTWSCLYHILYSKCVFAQALQWFPLCFHGNLAQVDSYKLIVIAHYLLHILLHILYSTMREWKLSSIGVWKRESKTHDAWQADKHVLSQFYWQWRQSQCSCGSTEKTRWLDGAKLVNSKYVSSVRLALGYILCLLCSFGANADH